MASAKNAIRRDYGSGTVSEKKRSGRPSLYLAKFRGPDGRRYSKQFPVKKLAADWLLGQQADVARGTWEAPHAVDLREPSEGPSDGTQPFGAFAQRWMETRRTKTGRPLRPRTLETYEGLLAIVNETFADTPLTEISSVKVREWIASLPVDRAPRNHDAFALLRAILNTAVEDELLVSNPARGKFSAPEKQHGTIIATPQEIQIIVSYMPDRHRAAVLLAAWCALRFGEIAELRRKDIDMASGTISITRAVSRVPGGYVVGEPKTAAGRRRVTMPPHIRQDIETHLSQFVADNPEALLFPSVDGQTHLATSTFYGKRTRCRRNGEEVPGFGYYFARQQANRDDLHFHDLRHTGATLAARAGATTRELMQRLGHTTPQMAMLYQHADLERDRELANRLSALAESNL